MTEKKSITISIPEGEIYDDKPSGMNHYLYLDPEEREVSIWSNVGTGMPMSVFHRRALLVSIPSGVASNGLRKWVTEQITLITKILDEYLGSEWDGANHRGKWLEHDDAFGAYDLEYQLDELLRDAELPTKWHAGDYLSTVGWSDEQLQLMQTEEGREQLADELLAEAEADQYDVVLDRDELVEELEVIAAEQEDED